jgi:hypothetical protein
MKPITTSAEAEAAVNELGAIVEQLTRVIQEETALVHAGQMRGAAKIEPAKAELAGRLFAAGERLKANAKFVLSAVPAQCASLHQLQDSFRVVLQRNTMVLATAHAVSEGIVRRLSGELTRKAAPQVYGASGRAIAPNPRHARPLALSRTS